MERGLNTLKALALGTVPVLGLLVAVLLLQVSSAVVAVRKDVSGLALGMETALETVNRNCSTPGHIQPCGTLAQVDKTLVHLSDLSVQSQRAVRDADRVAMTEMQMLPVWNAAFTSTLQHVDQTAATVGLSVTRLTDAAVPVMGKAEIVLASSDMAVKDFQAAIQNPDVKETLHYVAESSKSIADGTAQADAILADGRKVADRYANPPAKHWYQRVWGVTETGAKLFWDFTR